MTHDLKHTAGPWRIGFTQGDKPYIEADQGLSWNNPTICHLYHDVTPEDSVTMSDWLDAFPDAGANAHLIAAAPELLAALEGVLDNDCEYWRTQARAVINKAKGRPTE